MGAAVPLKLSGKWWRRGRLEVGPEAGARARLAVAAAGGCRWRRGKTNRGAEAGVWNSWRNVEAKEPNKSTGPIDRGPILNQPI